ncbi:VVA0879 family protein [Paenibacillus larvae]
MKKQSLNEWQAEAKRHFGEKGLDWKFVCPKCGNIQSGQDFINLGISALSPQDVYQECVGRHTDKAGCNWAAYGLLGTLGQGRIVVTPEGNEVEVFDFAGGGDNQC